MRLFVQLLIASNFRRFLCSENSTVVKDVIKRWDEIFKKEKVPEPTHSIENIVAHVMGFDKIGLVYAFEDEKLTKKQCAELEKCCQCRLARMPMQYIVKEWPFRDLNLRMIPPVFIPRPETEEFVDLVLDYLKKNNLTTEIFLEVGTGTGAISLSLLKELPEVIDAVGIDKSYTACALSNINMRKINETRFTIINAELTLNGTIALSETNSTDPLKDMKFDLIVSNPPYVPTNRIRTLEPEVKLYEDLRALDGGPDGMRIIKPLMVMSSEKLIQNGSLFIEIDSSQPKLIKKWIEANREKYKLKLVEIKKDFCDKYRFVHIIKE